MFKKVHENLRNYVKKDFVQDKFDGIYPFDLNNIPSTKYKSFGEKNPDKVFYVIYRTPYEAGFFSNFGYVVGHLKLIEGTNFIPVIDFENFKTFYNNTTSINGTENSWEYYFEQPAGYSLDEVYQSKHVLFCDGLSHSLGSLGFKKNEKEAYFIKTFKVKPYINEIISKYNKFFENNNVLGVHFRGKDINIFPGHPFGATEKQMFKYTDKIIKEYSIDKIFVATDEQIYLDKYIKNYGDMVFYADNFRTKKINEFNINPRENHRYLLGLEVLTDAILLSKCQGLLCGASGMAGAVKLLNPNYEFVYEINNGKNSKNKYLARYLFRIKKLFPKFFGGLLDEVKIVVN